MTFTGNILSKEDISFPKPSFFTTAHGNFCFSFNRDNVTPGRLHCASHTGIRQGLPGRRTLLHGWIGKKPQRPTGFQLNLRLIKMGLVILPVYKRVIRICYLLVVFLMLKIPKCEPAMPRGVTEEKNLFLYRGFLFVMDQ